MTKIARSFFLPILLSLAGCSINSIEGSGRVISESRNVGDFHRIELNGSGEMTIEQTGKQALTITADDNLLPYLTSEVGGGRLVLGTERRSNIDPTRPIAYKLEVGKLDEIGVAGSGVVVANGIVSDRLHITASGDTRAKLSGQVDRLEIVVTGEGDFDAAELKSKEVKIMITGDGKAIVAASDELDVTIVGSGTVQYTGDPKVSQSITGSGSVTKR